MRWLIHTAMALALCASGISASREDNVGLLIRWGLYSIPAGEWNGQTIAGPGEWIMHSARIPIPEYAALTAKFNPAAFDAEAWVKFARDAGMKYLVFVAKDRDGFAMYRSTASQFNVFDATPFHRDPLQEIAAACARQGMKLGLDYSLAEDWHERDAGSARYLRSKAEPQIRELLTRYGPIALIRFEGGGRMDELVHSFQLATRIEPPGVALTTINDTGGFKKFDNHWKSDDDLIFRLVDSVSKGGNFQLSIGPTAEGIIPRPSVVTLEAIGEWLGDNGEAVYGAGPCSIEGSSTASWRCTAKPGKIFVTLFQWPDGPLKLGGVKEKVTRAYLMTGEHTALRVTQTGPQVEVELPKDPPLEGEAPEHQNLTLYRASQRAHLRRVVVLETR